ncbi:UNVERIFIED_CONTAM: hypothetical protein K2H54_018665 [Gekko kuhli]
MDQLVGLLDVQLRNLTPGGKDSAARSLNKHQVGQPLHPASLLCGLGTSLIPCRVLVPALQDALQPE